MSRQAMAAYRRAEPARLRKHGAGNVRRDLIPLDTATIRGKALESHRKAERELARLTDQLKRYHERDVPGFRAWCSRTFGALLTQLRELGLALQEKQALAGEIADLAFRDNLSEVAAYREALWRRANPEAAMEKDRRREEAERRKRESAEKKKSARGQSENNRDPDPWDDLDALFDGEENEPDSAEDGDFAEFIESLFGGARRARAPKAPAAENKSARELYRTIARHLHPDHHGRMSEARKHLWNEAQKAYRAGDVEILRTVLAQCESGEAGFGAHTPVSVILHLIRRLKSAMRPVRSQIQHVRRKPEWNFTAKIGNPHYVRNVEAMIREDLRHTRRELDDLTRALDALARDAARPARKQARASRPDPFFPGF